MKSLGIAIPCYYNHIIFISEILDAIEQSTILPNQVSISISSTNNKPKLKKYSFDIVVDVTSDIKNICQNRNTAAKNLQTDIISFIDCDDLPHIKRNEYILEAFKFNECVGVVHNYYMNTDRDSSFIFEDIGQLELIPEYINTFLPQILPWPINSNNKNVIYHNGHISLLKDVFHQFKYDENWHGVGEDCNLNARLIQSNLKLFYIKNRLSKYINVNMGK